MIPQKKKYILGELVGYGFRYFCLLGLYFHWTCARMISAHIRFSLFHRTRTRWVLWRLGFNVRKKTRKRHWNLLSKSVTTILILADIVHYHLHITLRFAGYIGNDCVDSNYIITLYNYFKYKRRLFNLLTFVCPQYTGFVSFPDNLRFIHAATLYSEYYSKTHGVDIHGSAEGDNSNTTVANFHVNTRFH